MIKSVEKAFRVLESLSLAEGPMRLSDIARANGMTRSNAFHLLQTLQELDYVRQAEDSSAYEVTFRAFEIGARILKRTGLVSVAHPFLVHLSEQVPENVMLNVRDGIWNVVADRIESRSVVRTLAFLGARAPLQAVSSGKVLLAHAPESIVQAVAANLTANPFEAMTTITVKIVNQLTGDLEFTSPQTLVAFALGMTLFVLTLGMNVFALYIVRKYREQYE